MAGRGGEGVLGESWDRRRLKRCRQGMHVSGAGRGKESRLQGSA